MMELCHINCQSVRGKTEFIHDYISDNDVDFAALTETWLTSEPCDQKHIADVIPLGYCSVNTPRPTCQKGGGIALIYKDTLHVDVIPSQNIVCFI